MKTIYILSNESRIVKATKSLDESTLWVANGGTSEEVEFGDYTELAAYPVESQVYVQNEEGETIANFTVELYNDPIEHMLHDCTTCHYEDNIQVGRVIAFGKNLEALNLTKDLTAEIMGHCETLASNELNNKEL